VSEQELRLRASRALDEIEATPRALVYAAIRGVVAGVICAGRKDSVILFRRLAGGLVLETRDGIGHGNVRRFSLPADVEARAGRVLEAL